MSIQCRRFRQRLNELLDLRVSPHNDIEITRHARVCKACDKWLTTQELALRSIGSLGESEPLESEPLEFAHRTTRAAEQRGPVRLATTTASRGEVPLRLDADRQHPRKSWSSTAFRHIVALAALAAMVAVGVYNASNWSGPQLPRQTASNYVESSTFIANVDESSDNPVPHENRYETTFPLDDLVVKSLSEFLAESTSNTKWLEPVATPIRPLADSMTSTFNVLRQAIPTGRRIAKPEINVQDSAVHIVEVAALA